MKKLSYLIIVIFLFNLIAQPATVSAQMNIPPGATITSAKLSLYVYGFAYQQVDVHRVTSPWNENTITWNSFSNAYDLAVIDSFTPRGPGWYTVDVHETLQDWVDGVLPNFGFLMRIQPPPANNLMNLFYSSEHVDTALRPKLEVCYTTPGVIENCIVIQRPAGDSGDVSDTYIYSNFPDSNFGTDDILFVSLVSGLVKETLIKFDFSSDNSDVSIIKYTNGNVASDPNGTDVPRIAPGQTVTWTYRVSNTGNIAIDRADVVVTDDQPDVTPLFDSEMTGNGDTIFDPGEVWWYKATGVAVPLETPPAGVKTYPGYCTNGGTEAPRTAYINQGTVNIPGASATAQSSYCNTSEIPDVAIIKYTNGQLASDPNGTDVPQIAPGQSVEWTYRVSNIGNVSVDRSDVVVTDDQPGLSPIYDSELTGNGDTIFNPGEVWWYKATGLAVPLDAPPAGVKTYPGYCTNGQTEDPRTAYINQGTVNIPGADATAQSSYCNPSELITGYKVFAPFASNQPALPITTPFRVTVGYEDLPLALLANDFDYNDFIADIIGTGALESPNSTRWSSITLSITPNGRGAVLKHAFHMVFPANTFASNGSYTLTTFGPSGSVLSTQEGVFSAGTSNDFNIFPNTGDVFPKDLSNTIESEPMETAQRSAQLRISFDTPVDFNFADYDYVAAHGTGLFFDPYLDVLGSTDEVHRGDIRLLNVPEQSGSLSPFVPFEWPEERMRIDRVYTNITFIPNSPVPDVIFPNNWWLTHNNCVVDDVPCPLTIVDASPANFTRINK